MENVYVAITAIRKKTPWIGIVLQCLELVESTRFPTMATNAKQVMINTGFVATLSMPQLQGILVHETLHVINRHMFRRGERDPKQWNIAADHAINYLVELLGYELPKGGMKPIPETAERLYQDRKTEDAFGDKSDDSDSDDSDSDDSQSGDSDSDDTGDSDSESDSTDSDDSGDSDTDSSESQSDSGGDATAETDTGDCDGDSDGDILDYPLEPGQTMEDAEREVSDMIAKAQVTAAICGDEISDTEAEIFAKPEATTDWAEELAEFIEHAGNADYSLAPPNLILANHGIIANRLNPAGCGNVIFVVDKSQSMDDEKLAKCLVELENALDNVDYESVRILTVDNRLRDDAEFSRGESLDIEIVSGGGTAFNPAFEHIEEQGLACDLLIYFTDMEVYQCRAPEVEPAYPVCWAVYGSVLNDDGEWTTGDYNNWFCPEWGHRIKLND